MENRKSYDVAVLGGGLTGFTAAVRCAQLGKKTALIEEHALGGAGRQLGTVPIHFLLQNAKIIRACTESKDKGLRFGKVSLNIEALHKAYETKLEKLATVLRCRPYRVSSWVQALTTSKSCAVYRFATRTWVLRSA